METPRKGSTNGNKENEMDISCSDNNDSLVLKDIKIETNSYDCLEESPYLKTLPQPKQVFKLSRKRLSSELDSPVKKPNLSNNLFKNQFQQQTTTVTTFNVHKKWRSSSYNPITSSPKKDQNSSPLKDSPHLNGTSSCSTRFNSSIDNLLISNLNMMIQKSEQQPNLMGDYSSTYALPLISGRHKDLKTISPETLANLMNGDYNKLISCFTIVDSRYPYEYEGGHIDGSKNIYHKEEINKYFFGTDKPSLLTSKTLIESTIEENLKKASSFSMQRDLNLMMVDKQDECDFGCLKRLSVIKEGENDDCQLKAIASTSLTNKDRCFTDIQQQIKRHAIIFHCEFSSERGPSMCRYLRKVDRELNENCYPFLYYPELYLLHGGYKLFYEKFKELCYPKTYLPMHSIDHKQDLIKFRTKSKSWNCGDRNKWKSTAK